MKELQFIGEEEANIRLGLADSGILDLQSIIASKLIIVLYLWSWVYSISHFASAFFVGKDLQCFCINCSIL
jgi:hypothetical protein